MTTALMTVFWIGLAFAQDDHGGIGGNTVQEGPWQVLVDGVEIGRVGGGVAKDVNGKPCSDSGSACTSPGVTFYEYFQGKTNDAFFLSSTTTLTWQVKAAKRRSITCTTDDKCGRISTTTGTASAVFPDQGDAVDFSTSAVWPVTPAYHEPGKYVVHSIESGELPTLAYYYIKGSSGGAYIEDLCLSAGFQWPRRGVLTAVMWSIAWASDDPYVACPTGWDHLTYTVVPG